MKINKYILLAFIAICGLFVTLINSSTKLYTIPTNGIRPGLVNSHVALGRPMWVS